LCYKTTDAANNMNS